jgi:hypothetical protein
LGPDYGKFIISSVEAVAGTFQKGTSVELMIEKVTMSFGGTIPSDGGFYLAYGFEPDSYRVQQVGLGADPSFAGEGNEVYVLAAAVHPPIEYKAAESTIKHGMYDLAASGLKLPSATLSNMRTMCRVLSASNVGLNTEIVISDFNFLKQKYKGFIGGLAIVQGQTPSTIIDIQQNTSTVIVQPAFSIAPASGVPIALIASGVSTDDRERQTDMDNFLTIPKSTQEGLFTQLVATAGSALQSVVFADNAPLSSALIGRRLQGIGGVVAGEVRTIVRIASPAGVFSTLVVDAPFPGIPAVADEFDILPAQKDMFNNIADRVGGVYTGINDPDAVNSAGTKYPALTGTGTGREYGIVQEYVEYSSVSGNILTLSEPYYPKYDHLPGSRVIIGANKFNTAGDGSDYRPFLTFGYLDLLFNSDIVGLKSLFCAAGIDGKTEITELGS